MVSKPKVADGAHVLVQAIENSIAGLMQMVDDARVRIGEIKAERERMEETRVSKTEALKRVDSWLASLQERGTVAVQRLTYRDAGTVELIQPSVIDVDGYATMTEAAAAMVYFFPDVIRSKLVAEIDAVYANGVESVAAGDYSNRLNDIDARLFAAEMEEERIIQRAEDSGLTIHRRSDINPRVLLEA